MRTPADSIAASLGTTSYVATCPPSAFTSATPGMVRSAGRMVQSSSVRRSASERLPPSMVNMKISDSGVAMGASPPETVSGSWPITPDSRSPTCWRAQ